MPSRTVRIDAEGEPEWVSLGELAGRIRISNEYVVLADHWIPTVLEISANGEANDQGDPELYARVEVDENGPRLRELRLLSTDPDSQGIRQVDLREIQISSLVEDFVAGFTFVVRPGDDGRAVVSAGALDPEVGAQARRLIERLRGSRMNRDITPALLQNVARIYRENIAGHPTKAVQHHFQVGQRQAAGYVARARAEGFLPPTKRGKKNA